MKKKNKLYIEATSLYEKGYIDKALEKCEEGIAEDMKNSAILNLKGLLLYLKGDLNGAVTAWKINSDFNDDTTAKNYIKDSKEDEKRLILYKNAEKLIRDLHIDEAINNLNVCLESDFNSIKVNTLIAACYLKKGNYDLASIHITKALEIDRNNQFSIKVAKNIEEFAGIKLVLFNNTNHSKFWILTLLIIAIGISGFFAYKYFFNSDKEESKVVAEQNFEAQNKEVEQQVKENKADEQKKENKEQKVNENKEEGQNNIKVNIEDIQEQMNNKDYMALIDSIISIKDLKLEAKEKTICYNAKQLLNSEGIANLYNEGVYKYDNKQYNEGIKYFSKILNYDKNNFYYSYALFYMGLSNESLGQIDETIKYYDMYLKDYPSEAYAPGVAYSLMLIYKNVDIDKSISYAQLIADKYSKSMYNNGEVYALLNTNIVE